MDNRYLSKILLAFAEALERLEQRITAFRQEAIPGLSSELLPEWETDLGLSPGTLSLEERQAIVHAKYTGNYEGQGRQVYIDYAAKLGVLITVQEYGGVGSVFRVDINRVDRMEFIGVDGARLWSLAFRHKWLITVLDLGPMSIESLKAQFELIKPAQTEIVWNFS